MPQTVAGCVVLLASAAWPGRAQDVPAAPSTQISAAERQRMQDLAALIEGQNTPQARRTGARELLRQGRPETPKRLAAILAGSSRPAKLAVALALSDLPEYLADAYLDPLVALLADPDQEVRRAAAQALAAYRDGGVIRRLRSVVFNTQQPLPARAAAIETLGLMTQREAIAVLIDVLAHAQSPLSKPALTALEQATAFRFRGDVDAARAWWQATRDVPLPDWQRLQIQRLVRQNREATQQLHTLELRLVSALRDGYLRTPEAERAAALGNYLTDVASAVRLLGLQLVQANVAEGKTLSAETATQCRALLAASDPVVRAAAVRVVAGLRDAADADRFIEMLSAERRDAVRQALVNGLGYVGASGAVPALRRALTDGSEACSIESVTALGRLAERGVLDPPALEAVTTALLGKFRSTAREDAALRERLVWAMSRLGDPRFGPVFVAALDAAEAAPVRQAAVRGVAVLIDPHVTPTNATAPQPTSAASQPAGRLVLSPQELADALLPAVSDPDLVVRKSVVEALARVATTDLHLQTLWTRLATAQEPDESIRETAWRGILRVLARRPAAQIETWITHLPENGAARAQRTIELLKLAEESLATEPAARAELGLIQARIGKQRAALGQVDDAVATYLKALENLHALRSAETPRVALDLLRLTLLNERYDERIAGVLAGGNPPLDGRTLWAAIREQIEQRVNPDAVDQAINMLVALQTHPPTSMPADVQAALAQLLQRARRVRAEADTQLVNAALEELRRQPDDENARQLIVQLGRRAVPALRAALKAVVSAEPPDPETERRLHDLLKAVWPQWPGFPPDAARSDKLRALEAPNA